MQLAIFVVNAIDLEIFLLFIKLIALTCYIFFFFVSLKSYIWRKGFRLMLCRLSYLDLCQFLICEVQT